ncbi:MAG: aldolase/citrate lyase family protein [Acidimicrobiales bacterium]|nr:aldolase/citrate lyase family protein [Acidimicrobiales bacterium]
MTSPELPAPFDPATTELGCWLKLPSSIAAEAASLLGFDYVCIDMQHGLLSRSDLTPMLQAVHPHSPRVLVRVPANDPSTIGWCLDAGATGVIVPLINSADEAEAAVRAAMYPPRGDRSTGPARAAVIYGNDYVHASNTSVQCIPMIETTRALGSLDGILSLPDVNAIYVGPSDLSVSLGLGPGNHDGETAFDDALTAVLDACNRHGVVPGIHANPSLATRRLEQGFRIVTIAEDLSGMQGAMSGALNTIRGD